MAASRDQLARKFHVSRRTDMPDALQWSPPRDSVALFDALREAFPYATTLPELMTEASIDFFMRERDEQRRKAQFEVPALLHSSLPESARPIETSESSALPIHEEPSAVITPHRLGPSSTLRRLSFPSTHSDFRAVTPLGQPDPALKKRKTSTSLRDSMNSMIRTFQLPANGQRVRKAKRPMTDEERKQTTHIRRVKPCDRHKRSKHRVSTMSKNS
jgi:hypothetical protein